MAAANTNVLNGPNTCKSRIDDQAGMSQSSKGDASATLRRAALFYRIE
jgi:hypothetical protein